MRATTRCLRPLGAAVLFCAVQAGAQNPRLNLLKNSGFEQVKDGNLEEWTLVGNMANVSTERAHAGKQSLKIVDAEDKKGSSTLSPTFSVIPKREYFLKGWAYLVQGSTRNPLGIYLWSLDEQGKEVRGPGGKQSFVAPRLTEGRWVHFFQPVTVFGEARKMRVLVRSFDAAQCTAFVDDVELLECFPGVFGDALGWQGGSPDHLVTHTAECSVRWACVEADQVSKTFQPPLDWSKYSGASVWIHSNLAAGNAVILVLASENPKTEGPDYYTVLVPLDWTGWRQFVFAFKDMKVGRTPIGLKRIERIYFAATGWNLTFNPNVVLHFEDLKPANISQ